LREGRGEPDEEALPRLQDAQDAIFTFVNKLDRPGRDPFELVGEVEEVLGIGVYPMTWPIFEGARFRASITPDRQRKYFSSSRSRTAPRSLLCAEIDATSLESAREGPRARSSEAPPRRDRSFDAAGDALDLDKLKNGEVTPMFFGSALTNFGLPSFSDAFVEMIDIEPGRETGSRCQIEATDERFTSFVFSPGEHGPRAP